MKNIKLLALLWIALFTVFISWCWNNVKVNSNNNTEDINSKNNDVINYNNSIIKIASKCGEYAMTTWDSYDNNNEIIQTETYAKNTLSECQNSINQINTLWDRQWDSSLKDWIISLLNLYVSYFTKFNKMLTYLENDNYPKENITSYETLVKEIKEMDKEIEDANSNFTIIQRSFAKNHWFELENNDE